MKEPLQLLNTSSLNDAYMLDEEENKNLISRIEEIRIKHLESMREALAGGNEKVISSTELILSIWKECPTIESFSAHLLMTSRSVGEFIAELVTSNHMLKFLERLPELYKDSIS